jgi:hypothetical protein
MNVHHPRWVFITPIRGRPSKHEHTVAHSARTQNHHHCQHSYCHTPRLLPAKVCPYCRALFALGTLVSAASGWHEVGGYHRLAISRHAPMHKFTRYQLTEVPRKALRQAQHLTHIATNAYMLPLGAVLCARVVICEGLASAGCIWRIGNVGRSKVKVRKSHLWKNALFQ